ncbi:MAG TPA: hypothetical protein PLZ86_09605, partial [bacterium]|nr:hypothetical protein [bacterium]
MICAGETIKKADACTLAAACNDVAREPIDYELEGERGTVVIRDDGDGLFNECDRIGIASDGSFEDEDGAAVKERLGAMGIKEFPPYNTPLKALTDYVTNMQEAKRISRGQDASAMHGVGEKLVAARGAAAKA